MDDFYATLGVPPNAAIAEIKDRYRFLAHAYHPDKFSSDAHKRDADEAFKKINEAFQTLSNPSLRAAYDRQRASGPASEPRTAPPPPRPPPESPPRQAPRKEPPPAAPASQGKSSLSPRTIIFLLIAAGIAWAVLHKPPAEPKSDPWAQFKDAPPQSAFDPTTSKPFDPDAYLASKGSPTPAKPTGFEDLGAVPEPPAGFKMDARPATSKPAPSRANGGGFVAPQEDIDYDRRLRESLAATKERPFVNSLGMQFVPVPGTKVLFCRTVTRVRDWQAFIHDEGDAEQWGLWVLDEREWKEVVKKDLSWRNPGFAQTREHPVVGVDWGDANRFCTWLSRKEGLTYRMPTDAEWSAAVGPETYPWGNQFPPPTGAGNYGDASYLQYLQSINVRMEGWKWEIANYRDGYARTSPVGSFAANRYGLYDMGGNVWQWCDDDYRASMNSADVLQKFPTLRQEKESDGTPLTLFRGGSWLDHEPLFLRSSCRVPSNLSKRADTSGFRVVLAVPDR